MKSDPENLQNLVAKVVEWLTKQRWKKIAWACVSCLKFQSKIRARAQSAIVMQKIIRMHLARSIHKARYLGIKHIRALGVGLGIMHEIVEKLQKNKEKMMAVSFPLFASVLLLDKLFLWTTLLHLLTHLFF
jgi:myosin-6